MAKEPAVEEETYVGEEMPEQPYAGQVMELLNIAHSFLNYGEDAFCHALERNLVAIKFREKKANDYCRSSTYRMRQFFLDFH